MLVGYNFYGTFGTCENRRGKVEKERELKGSFLFVWITGENKQKEKKMCGSQKFSLLW